MAEDKTDRGPEAACAERRSLGPAGEAPRGPDAAGHGRRGDPDMPAPDEPGPDPRESDDALAGSSGQELSASDPRTVIQVRDILTVLANTVSAMKIFPAEHSSVRTFVDDFGRKLRAFLELNGQLLIAIREHAFVLGDKPVYRDDQPIKSLPFFFHKDGMQSLAFYQGLDREEIGEWLRLIRRESLRPSDESDIVSAMWERDFPNIHYTAPESFIENRILEERNDSLARSGQTVLPPEFAARAMDIQVDRAALEQGRIELTPEDLAAIRDAQGSAAATEAADRPAAAPVAALAPEASGPPDSPPGRLEPPADLMSAAEAAEIESLVLSSRATSPEADFIDLMIEILILEKDAARFREILDNLAGFRLEQLRKGRFLPSVLISAKIEELQTHFLENDPDKARTLAEFRETIGGEMSLGLVKEGYLKAEERDPDGLIEFLRLVGLRALPCAAELYEAVADQATRDRLLAFLAEAGARDPAALVAAADARRPLVSREIIRFVAALPDPRAAQHLARFLSFDDKGLKSETIEALSRLGGEMAGKILAGFLSDADEEIRIQAALRLGPLADRNRLLALIADAGRREFRDRSDAEKTAVFGALGRTRTPEALSFLAATLRRHSFRRGSAVERLRLCAAHGLETMGTPEAVAALRRGASAWAPAVRAAVAQALRRLGGAPLPRAGGESPSGNEPP